MIWLYFIQAGESGPIKIGLAGDPQHRLRGLQTAHYESLRLLAERPGGPELEADLHARFAAGRLSGEWFRPDTPGLAEAIKAARRAPRERFVSRRETAERREQIEARASRLARDGHWDDGQALIATIPSENGPAV